MIALRLGLLALAAGWLVMSTGCEPAAPTCINPMAFLGDWTGTTGEWHFWQADGQTLVAGDTFMGAPLVVQSHSATGCVTEATITSFGHPARDFRLELFDNGNGLWIGEKVDGKWTIVGTFGRMSP